MKFEIPRLTRCCFCMPLRRGVLTFGCIGAMLSAFMIGMFSYLFHYCNGIIYRSLFTVIKPADAVVILAMYCVQFLANIILVYAAHKKIVLCLKIFYYYTLCTVGAIFILIIVACTRFYIGFIIHLMILSCAVICCQAYLLILVRSLYIKLERSDTHQFGNELCAIVVGEREINSDVSNIESDRRHSDTSNLQD